MIQYLIIGSFIIALFSSLYAVTARSAERLLWGLLLCSLALALSVEAAATEYYGVLMAVVFLISDLVLFMYLRTRSLLPKKPPQNPKAEKLFRFIVLWGTIVLISAAAIGLFYSGPIFTSGSSAGSLALIHDRIWNNDWLLVVIAVFSLITVVVGGFLLVREDH